MENYKAMDHEKLMQNENEFDDEVAVDTFDGELVPEEEVAAFEEDVDFPNDEVQFDEEDLSVANG